MQTLFIKSRLIPLIALAVGLSTQPSFADVTSYARFDFNAGFLTSGPLSRGSSKAAGNQKIVAQDVYNLNSATSAATYTSPDSYVKYDRWANGLSAGEGIASFNIFLYSNYANAASWGQQLKLPASNSAFGLSATAGDGWNYKVVSMNQDNSGLTPGSATYGYSIQWWTTNENSRINGSSLPGFSFTAPVELFDSTTNDTWAVKNGGSYAVWFGTQNRPGDTLFTAPDNFIQPIKFDNNWEGGAAGDTFASGVNSVWNGTMMLSAAVVIPEPTTGSLVLVSLTIGAVLRRRRSPSL